MEANERGSEGAEELLRFSFEEAREEQLSITARVPDESTGSLDSQQDTSSSHETVGYSELPAGERNPPVWRQGWKCTFAILGFYLLAFLCATAHLCVFLYLHERTIQPDGRAGQHKSTKIPQTYATTISLVLVTVFRAALIACIGVCYTQYLWETLRVRLHEVGLIEDLFQIRSNPFRLLSHRLLRYSPTLALVAALSWLVPVAMIYPPGALVVDRVTLQIDSTFNVSVFQPNDRYEPKDLYTHKNGFAYYLYTGYGRIDMSIGRNATMLFVYGGYVDELGSLTNTIVSNRKSVIFEQPRGENPSYRLQFWGPVVQCNDSSFTNVTELRNISTDVGTSEEGIGKFDNGVRNFNLSSNIWSSGIWSSDNRTDGPYLVWKQCLEKAYYYSPCLPDELEWAYDAAPILVSINLLQPMQRTECFRAAARYDVEISFLNGIQTFEYSTTAAQPFPHAIQNSSSSNFGPLRSWAEYVNINALLDSLGALLEYHGDDQHYFGFSFNPFPRTIELFNGSTVEACGVKSLGILSFNSGQYDPLIYSLFNDNWEQPIPKGFITDPYNLTITEARLNEVLANITFAALSLNNWRDTVKGTQDRTFNAYNFEHRINFFLPYGLCLLFTVPAIVIGLLALQQNNTTAIDGGFLQILMTTNGRTKLEEIASEGCLGGQENVPPELEKLKVRFGELILDDDRQEKSGSSMPDDVVNTTEDAGFAGRSSLAENDGGEEQRDREAQNKTSVKNNIKGQEVNNRAGSATSFVPPVSALPAVRRFGFGTLEETKPLRVRRRNA